MSISIRTVFYSVVRMLWIGLLFSPLAWGRTAEVRDGAGFFSAETVNKANAVIQEIKERFGKDLLIETVKTVPEGKEQEARNTDPNVRRRFFSEWARERARQARVNGVYVLICRQPGHLEVAVGNKTKQSGEFSAQAQSRLNQLLVDHFRRKDYNGGLIAAVDYVKDTFGETIRSTSSAGNLPRSEAPARGMKEYPSATSSGSLNIARWVFIILAILAGIWIVKTIARAMKSTPGPGTGAPSPGMGTPTGTPGGMGTMGGGGFWNGMLGGLFGAAAGSWLYDRFFRSSPQPPYGSQAYAGPGDEQTRWQDEDYTSTGSDFDAEPQNKDDYDSNADDFDSGDFDSGDFGGGDDT